MSSSEDMTPIKIKESKPSKEKRVAQRSRAFGAFEDIIILVVGPEGEQKSFIVHENILCASSPFFNAACKPEWLKGRTINLEEDDHEVIQVLIHWMYEKTLCLPEGRVYGCGKNIGQAMKSVDSLIIQVYILANKYQIPDLETLAIDALLVQQYNNFEVPFLLSKLIYDNTTPDSPLRKLLIDMASADLEIEKFQEIKEELHYEFIVDFTAALLMGQKNKQNMEVIQENFCERYHKHPLGTNKCAEKKEAVWYFA